MLKFQKLAKIYSNEILPFAIKIQNQNQPRNANEEEKENPLHYFRVFLNFGYFLLFIPFKVVVSERSYMYSIKTSAFHKTTCAVIYTLSAYRFGTSIREVLNSHTDDHPSPVLYFEICRSIFTAIYMAAFKWTFCTRSTLFCSIVNDLVYLRMKIPPLVPSWNVNVNGNARFRHGCSVTQLATLICLMYSVPPLLSVILGSDVINVAEWKVHKLFESYAGIARYTFFLQETKAPLGTAQFNFSTYALICLYIVMNFYYFLAGHYFDLSVLMGALTLRNLAKHFAKNVSRMNLTHINKILADYETLKDLSKKVNRAIGPVAFCFVVEALPWYATHFDDILTLEDWYSRFRYIFYFFNFFSILIIASDIIVKVESLKVWISKGSNSTILPSSKLVVLMNELSTCPVALKPGGILTITYGFIGTMVSVVVTYAVIILQFNFTSHGCTL